MLITCANPNCSIQFSSDFEKCPACGAAPGLPMELEKKIRPKHISLQDIEITRGKQILTLIFGCDLGSQLVALVGWIWIEEMAAATGCAFGIFLSFYLMMETFDGKRWARVSMLVLLAISFFIVAFRAFSTRNPFQAAMAGGFLVYFYALIGLPSVSAYLKSKRTEAS